MAQTRIPEISDLDVVFGDTKHLPAFADLPKEFQRGRSPFCHIAEELFFNGGKVGDHGLTPKEGVDVGSAVRVLRSILGSFEPKHEHKIGGVGFLLSQWFDRKTD